MLGQIRQMDVARQMADNGKSLNSGNEWHVIWTVTDISESDIPYEVFDRLIIQTSERPNRDGKLLEESVAMGMAVYSEGQFASRWYADRAYDALENGIA